LLVLEEGMLNYLINRKSFFLVYAKHVLE
jgi:hypothetical protein